MNTVTNTRRARPSRMSRTVAVALTMIAVLAGSFAMVAPAEADPLPTCESIESMNCTGSYMNTIRGEQFCQITDGAQRCEQFWPFRNPTINISTAMGHDGAYPDNYYWYGREYEAQKGLIARRDTQLQRRADRIERLLVRIERLRDRLHR